MTAPDATRDGYGWLPYEDATTTIARLTAELAAKEAENRALAARVTRLLGDTDAACYLNHLAWVSPNGLGSTGYRCSCEQGADHWADAKSLPVARGGPR